MFIRIEAIEAANGDVATFCATAFGVYLLDMDFAHVSHVGDVGLAVFSND